VATGDQRVTAAILGALEAAPADVVSLLETLRRAPQSLLGTSTRSSTSCSATAGSA
jgi:hypothetical protein